MNLKWIKIGTIFKWSIRPMVWAYDKVWGTDMLQCEVCHKRELVMNLWADNAFQWVKNALTRK